MEYWYDPKHTGCLRVIDHKKQIIHGSDPKEEYWCVPFHYENNKNTLVVDFHKKSTHSANIVIRTRYEDRRMTLHWDDGNKWRRMKMNPNILLSKIK